MGKKYRKPCRLSQPFDHLSGQNAIVQPPARKHEKCSKVHIHLKFMQNLNRNSNVAKCVYIVWPLAACLTFLRIRDDFSVFFSLCLLISLLCIFLYSFFFVCFSFILQYLISMFFFVFYFEKKRESSESLAWQDSFTCVYFFCFILFFFLLFLNKVK